MLTARPKASASPSCAGAAARAGAGMIVVKLGGSLAKARTLHGWLKALARGKGRAIVVPGGGAFADTVRAEQDRLHLSDRAAHRMAILAMEQYALALRDICAEMTACASESDINDALARGSVPVWLPATMALADLEIPESWDVTSDSLAAWLARRLGAGRLILVKSTAAPRPLDPAVLAERGLVDRLFPRFFDAARLRLDWVGPGEEDRLANLLAHE
jgi:5-(aminomethyl)-3-furanmethanol phosphate kinase